MIAEKRKKRRHSNSFDEVSVTWISKPDKEGKSKENHRSILLKDIVLTVPDTSSKL